MSSAGLRREVPSPWRTRLGRADPVAIVLALMLAVFLVVGASFNATDSSAWFTASVGAAFGSTVVVLVLAALLYLPIRFGYAWLDRRWDIGLEPEGLEPRRIISMRRAMRRWLLPSFLILLAGWLPWLLLHYPGNVDSDTITQLFQWIRLARRVDHHPWFDTMVFGWFWDLGRATIGLHVGLFVFLLVQLLATALGMALLLTYLGRLGLGRTPRLVLTASVALFPIYPMAVGVMSKDSFAAVFWFPFFVLYVEALRTRGRVLCRPWIGLAAIAVVIPLVLAKRTNVYIFLACLVVLLAVSLWRTRLRLAAGGLLVLLVTNVVWPHVVLPAWQVAPGTLADTLSVPLQQTARVVARHGDQVPANERAAINAVLRYDGLAKAYDPRRSDSVKGRWKVTATTAEKAAYWRTWLAEFVRYPGTYASATINNTYEYFAPLTPIEFQTNLRLERYVDYWLSRSIAGTTKAQIEAMALSLHPAPALDQAQLSANNATKAFLAATPLASKAFWSSWIPLFVLGFALRRRSWLLGLAMVPLMLSLGMLVAGPIALPRYMLPLIFGDILAIGLALTPARWLPRRITETAAPAGVTSPSAVPGDTPPDRTAVLADQPAR